MENSVDCDQVERWNRTDPDSKLRQNGHRLHAPSEVVDSLLDYLKIRYLGGRIYAEAKSNVLLMINDWNEARGIHGEKFVEFYRRRKRYGDLAPHLYRTCWWCCKSALERNRDQCVVFMGEAGSGKTRSFDRGLDYFVESFSTASPVQARKLLHVQAVLKSFCGIRLKDMEESCRFMQFLEIELDFGRAPQCARISVLPLDRTRAIERMAIHGGFNIFYALLLGAELQLLKSLKLQRNPNLYAYLKSEFGSRSAAGGERWRRSFCATKAALNELNFTATEIQELFQLLAVLLKLGNVTLRACVDVDGSVGCVLDNETEIAEAAQLLGCEQENDLSHALTKSSGFYVHGELVQSFPDVDEYQAGRRRNSICETLWNRLFRWLTGKLNQALRCFGNANATSSTKRPRKVCFLDSAGFERLEQGQKGQHLDCLLRNYAAERSFCHFVTTEFRRRQQSYLDEGLQWNCIVDETECESCVGVIDVVLESMDIVQSAASVNGPTRNRQWRNKELLVTHFFGEVTYDFVNVGDEPLTVLPWSSAKAFYNSKNGLAKLLFPEGATKHGGICDGHQHSRARKSMSAASQFKVALSSILKTLETVDCNYIVCIKPNEIQRPNVFDRECVERQLKAFRVPELLRLGSSGFEYIFTYDDFLQRYKTLSPLTWPRWKGSTARGGVSTILHHQLIGQVNYALGRHGLFVKDAKALSTLEERRSRSLNYLASIIQRAFRRWLLSNDHRTALNRSQSVIAARYRSFKARREFLMKRKAAKIIQGHIRSWKVRKSRRAVRRRNLVVVLCHWLKNIRTRRYLLKLARNLPSTSPTASDWPQLAPSFCVLADDELRRLYHKWRCQRYRLAIDQPTYYRMREKLAASLLFKDKKAHYPATVSHPFHGDYVRIRQNAKWRRLAAETGDEYVVFAEVISKLHRSSGKTSPELLIVSTNAIVVMDYRMLTLKRRLFVCDLVKISTSPFSDCIAVFHFKNTFMDRRSSDFMFECRHLIEVVAKLYLVVYNATGQPPFVNISPMIFLDTGSETMELLFHERESDKDESDDWTGCFITTPVLPISFPKANGSHRQLLDQAGCSSGSENGGCSSTLAKLQVVKRGNRIDFYV